MKVCVQVGEGTATSAASLALRCTPAERKVWIERGDGAGRKIVFSSTFDAVVDGASGEAAEDALYAAALQPAGSPYL